MFEDLSGYKVKKELMMQNKRLDFLDATKGVAILCITLLHVEDGVFPVWLNTWIGLFMITAFYLTSGWVSYGKELPDSVMSFFMKRLRQLGIPYISFSFLIVLFEVIWILLGFMDKEILYRDVYKTLTLRGIGTLWFLPVLLFSETLFLYIRKSKHKILLLLLFFFLTLVIPYLYNFYWLDKLENHLFLKLMDSPIRPIVQTLTAWPVIAAGYFLAKYISSLLLVWKNYNKILLGILVLILSVFFVAKPPFELYFVNGFLSNILPPVGFILLFSGIKTSFLTRFFVYWGKNSLILMATHYSITEVLIRTFDKYLLGHEIFTGPITLIYFIVIIMLTYPWVYLFNHPLRFALGKK